MDCETQYIVKSSIKIHFFNMSGVQKRNVSNSTAKKVHLFFITRVNKQVQ